MTNKDSICCGQYILPEFYLSSDVYSCSENINKLLKGEANNLICPTLLHTLVPYYLTLTRGGGFTWMRDRSKVIVQCPRVDNPCVVEVQLINSGDIKKIKIKILDIDSNCSVKFKKNQVVILDDILPKGFCLLGFDNVFPYIEHMRQSGLREMSFSCSCRDNNSVVHLKKNNSKE